MMEKISSTKRNHFLGGNVDWLCASSFKIDEDEIMVSFYITPLFTAIPVDRACEFIRNKLNKDKTLKHRTKLSIDDIIKLLRFTLSNSY